MREDVLILLNEREPLKQQMAAALVEQLEARRLSHHRLKPSAQLAEIVVERRPKVLVADFLLGDEGTALDLLSNLREHDPERKIQCILWTDERSVGVAVTAMKLGARDYIELGSAKDVEKLLRSIDEAIEAAPNEDQPAVRRPRTIVRAASDEPIAQSPSSRNSLASAEMAIHQHAPVIVLYGEPGCGRSTVAQYLHSRRLGAGSLSEIDLENWDGAPDAIFGNSKHATSTPLLSAAATVVIDHAEFDSQGDLLEACGREAQNIWPKGDPSGRPQLIIGTHDEKCAAAWARLTDAKKVKIPSLSERKDDMLPLLQRFISEAKQYGVANKVELTPEIIHTVSAWSWPGNIRQLRACILEVATAPPELLRQWIESSADAEGRPFESHATDQNILLSAIERSKSLYERQIQVDWAVPPPLHARKILDDAGGNYRIAAAHLGVGVPQVRAALSAADKSGAKESTR